MPSKRCLFCRRWFRPYAPMADRQRICGSLACRRKLKRSLDRAWRRRDPGWCKAIQAKRRAWAAARWYWRGYRRHHPVYRAREKARMRRKRVRDRRKTGIVTDALVEEIV